MPENSEETPSQDALFPPGPRPTKRLDVAEIYTPAELKQMQEAGTLADLIIKRNDENAPYNEYAAKRNVLKEEAARKSLEDPLTKLPNRRAFDQLIETEYARSQRFSHTFSVGMVDIDNFKTINDTEGHDAGDAVIQAVANSISGGSRQVDTFARYGGEEFAFLLPETGEERAMQVAERLRSNVQNLVVTLPDGRTKNVTVTIGVSNGNHSPKDMIKAADIALYVGKQVRRDGSGNPKNRVVAASSITNDELSMLKNFSQSYNKDQTPSEDPNKILLESLDKPEVKSGV